MRHLVEVLVVDLDERSESSQCDIDEQPEKWRPVSEETTTPLLGVVLGRQIVWARAGSAGEWRSAPRHGASDEHFAVDADSCKKHRWLECADVLYGIKPLPLNTAVERLRFMTTHYPGCRLAAVPVEGCGWAVASGPDLFRIVLRFPAGPPNPACADWPLLPSYLHGWLATGHALRELPPVSVTHLQSPAPEVHRTGGARPDRP